MTKYLWPIGSAKIKACGEEIFSEDDQGQLDSGTEPKKQWERPLEGDSPASLALANIQLQPVIMNGSFECLAAATEAPKKTITKPCRSQSLKSSL